MQLLKTKGPGASAMQQVIVFVNKKETCRRLARMLKNYGVEATRFTATRRRTNVRRP